MSSDELVLQKVIKAIKDVKLEAILVGNTACALQGVPLMTQDIDFFVRDTQLNRNKIKNFAKLVGGTIVKFDDTLTDAIRIETKSVTIDFVFRLAPGQSFESVRSKSKTIKLGDVYVKVAPLEEIYKSKKFYNREKDKAVLQLILNTIRVKKQVKK